ncbi:hypothetical protein AX16_001076 [Volvariella volvacea WC 439]|nr:hypothetical protein AX16_001076 [Volvariella volvacea WC 439]
MRTRTKAYDNPITAVVTNGKGRELKHEDEVNKSGRSPNEGNSRQYSEDQVEGSPLYPRQGKRRATSIASAPTGFPVPRRRKANVARKRAKRLAKALGPDAGCCLVTGQQKAKLAGALYTALIIPPHTNPKLLAALEREWGMRRGELSLNKPGSLMFLDSVWHRLFLEDTWVLLPSIRDVDLIKNRDTEKPIFEALKAQQPHLEPFEYRLLSLTPNIPAFGRPCSADELTGHRYPFLEGRRKLKAAEELDPANFAQIIENAAGIMKVDEREARNHISSIVDLSNAWAMSGGVAGPSETCQ